MYKNIGWFKIAMNDSKFVHLLESFGYLLYDIQSHFLVNFARRAEAL